jgi:flagella basal body P-ring formation protein FlgA
MRRLAAFAILLSLGGAAVAQTLEPLVPVMPTLKRQATITDELVRIGDLVENAGVAAATPIFRAPDPGETGAVEAFRVIEAVRRYGVVGVDTQGLAEVVVIRPGRIIPVRDIEDAIGRALAARYGLGEPADLALTFDREARPLHLEPAASTELQPTRVVYERTSGRFDLTFEVPGSTLTRATPLRYSGSAVETRNAAVLLHSLGRGDTVKAGDVAMERRPRSQVGDDVADDVSRVIGLSTRRPLRAGQALRTADLMKRDLVQRGDPVTLIFEVPGVMLSIRGKALEAGAEGDIVSVVNSQSKRTVHGTVSGPGRITVGSTVPRIAAAGLPSVATETRGPERRRTE